MTKILIPEAALSKHIAILGMNGSGKTSVAKSQIIEPVLRAKGRVCNIDPTGVGWGLRLRADGKTMGFAVYIVGGDHADFPLIRRDGHAWGEIVGTSSDSFVFDTSQMTGKDRSLWFTDFAETILRKNRGPLTFVLDEAHLFAPQGGAKSGGVAPDMLHATNNLLALGRSRGLRVTMISQRPAKLHKDSLTQAHTMIAMMVIGPTDRGAVRDWVADQADPETGRDIIASLPNLAPGEGWIWAPRERVLERVKFPRPTTFDSSAAPAGDPDDGPKLTPIDPEAVKAMFTKVSVEAVANDPAKLRAEIARLKADLAKKPAAEPVDVEAIRRDVEASLGPVWFRRGAEDMQRAFSAAIAAVSVKDAIDKGLGGPLKIASTSAVIKPGDHMTSGKSREPVKISAVMQSGDGVIGGPEQRIINAIRWWNVFGVKNPSHPQVGFIARYSHKSGTWARYLSTLRSVGMIEPKGDLRLTAAGEAAANDPAVHPTRATLHAEVLSKIDGPLQRILAPLLVAYPGAMSHAEAGEAAGYSHASGTWARYLSSLRSLELIEKRGDLKAQSWLFP